MILNNLQAVRAAVYVPGSPSFSLPPVHAGAWRIYDQGASSGSKVRSV